MLATVWKGGADIGAAACGAPEYLEAPVNGSIYDDAGALVVGVGAAVYREAPVYGSMYDVGWLVGAELAELW